MAIAQPSTVTPGVEQDAYPDTRQLLRMFDGRTESAPASTTATSTSATPSIIPTSARIPPSPACWNGTPNAAQPPTSAKPPNKP